MNREKITRNNLRELNKNGIAFCYTSEKGSKYLAYENGIYRVFTNWSEYDRACNREKTAVDYYNNAERHFLEPYR